jgi:hypothetical protein
MRVIELDTAETFPSLRDRILNGKRERVVLVVPTRGAALRGGVDLPLLRRLADRERLEVGLVTADRELARRARAVGLPAFASLTLAEHYRPGWWRARRRAERLGFPPGPIPDHPGIAASLSRSRRLPQALALLLALVLLAAVPLAAALYFLPGATITLRPARQPAQAIVEVTADPALAAADPATPAIPARPVQLSLAWEATGPGTNAAARQQVRALALQALNAGAADRLAARLAPGERLLPGATRVTLLDEQATTGDGATRLALQAELGGLAVEEAALVQLVFPPLAAALPSGFAPDPATLRLDLEPGAGDGAFVVTARATGRAQLDPAALAAQLVGQPLADAASTLDALPLAEPPRIDVGPGAWRAWFGRLPLRADRITIYTTP